MGGTRGRRASGRRTATLQVLRVLRKTFVGLFAVQLALAISMSLVDSYRRRGKKPKPFPVVTPKPVEVGDGTVTAYTFGRDLYRDMLAAIDSAQHQILFETYIWKGDAVGEQFKEALIRAADRGVDVRCIYDSFANLVVSPRFKQFPKNLKVLHFPVYPAGLKPWELRRYGRDHRKILVIDDDVAFVGGYNIGSAYADEWRDTHVRITGGAVADLKRAFADMWNSHRRPWLRATLPPLLVETSSVWAPQVRLIRNLPRLWSYPIRSIYLDAFQRADHHIWLTTAYFLPDQDFVDALKEASERGVDVRILLPLKSNHIVADWLARGYFAQLLDAGVRILRFKGAMIHAKTGTVDGQWSTIGTANIDRLSFYGNYEVNVEIFDPDLARVMEEIFLSDQSNSLELGAAEWQARDVHRKFTEVFLAPLRRFL